jgi:hypothetical protein
MLSKGNRTLSDIFISYASQDRERILPIVHALEKTGWSIFWDRTIPPGKTWRQLIGSEIQSARCVVVVWTAASIESRWVQEEAEIGSRKGILIPVSLDDVEPPFGFGTIQSANLADWDGDPSLPPFGQLLEAISSVLGTSPADQSEQEARRKAEEQAEKEAAERKQKVKPEVRKNDIAQKPAQHATAKVVPENSHTMQAGRIRISHLGSFGSRSNRASTAFMASLEREIPFS